MVGAVGTAAMERGCWEESAKIKLLVKDVLCSFTSQQGQNMCVHLTMQAVVNL